MCAPCKLLLNSGGAGGSLTAIEKALNNLNSRGYDITEENYKKGVDLICGFHTALLEWEKAISEGPYVPYEHKVI
jgi:hypothetical protein